MTKTGSMSRRLLAGGALAAGARRTHANGLAPKAHGVGRLVRAGAHAIREMGLPGPQSYFGSWPGAGSSIG
jgi:hypothetical protein